MQNQALFTILVGGTTAIVVSAAAALFFSPTGEEPAELVASIPAERTVDPSSISRTEFEEELEKLRVDNQMLFARIVELEEARALSENRRAVVAQPSAEEDRANEDPVDGLAALTAPDGTLAPVLEEGMRRAFEDFRNEEREESEQRWEEARQKELDARISRYTTQLNLDSYQAEEMRTILTDEQVRRGELMDAARETGSWDTLREDMRAVRTESREGLERVLTPEQLTQYDQSSRGRGGPPRGGTGGDRNGGGRNGGGRN